MYRFTLNQCKSSANVDDRDVVQLPSARTKTHRFPPRSWDGKFIAFKWHLRSRRNRSSTSAKIFRCVQAGFAGRRVEYPLNSIRLPNRTLVALRTVIRSSTDAGMGVARRRARPRSARLDRTFGTIHDARDAPESQLSSEIVQSMWDQNSHGVAQLSQFAFYPKQPVPIPDTFSGLGLFLAAIGLFTGSYSPRQPRIPQIATKTLINHPESTTLPSTSPRIRCRNVHRGT